MKKIIFFALSLQIIAVTGCNNNNKDKETATDSTAIVGNADSNMEQMKAYFAGPVPGFNADSTVQNLSKYPDLFNKTKTVKFNYNNFSLFIDSLDKKFNVSAKEIHLVYGAYTPAAVNWYLKNHQTLTHADSLSILNKPCLIIAYKDPAGQFIYATDIGTICPPPNSCESFANYLSSFNTTGQAGFDPGPTIANYDVQYQDGKNPIYPLTQRVKFDIAAIRYLADSLNRAGNATTDIYFAVGAYTYSDALRYVGTHPGKPPITAAQIQDRTCLLLAFKKPDANSNAVPQFFYHDIGTICPPPNSCETAFSYIR
jgi:hypothetical protein